MARGYCSRVSRESPVVRECFLRDSRCHSSSGKHPEGLRQSTDTRFSPKRMVRVSVLALALVRLSIVSSAVRPAQIVKQRVRPVCACGMALSPHPRPLPVLWARVKVIACRPSPNLKIFRTLLTQQNICAILKMRREPQVVSSLCVPDRSSRARPFHVFRGPGVALASSRLRLVAAHGTARCSSGFFDSRCSRIKKSQQLLVS